MTFNWNFNLLFQVIFVDEKSRSFVKESENCDFFISSFENPSGILENPKHSLPPNTTCRYHFQGKPNEIVWISFIKYYAATIDPAARIDTPTECNAKLLIWNGDHSTDKPTSRKVNKKRYSIFHRLVILLIFNKIRNLVSQYFFFKKFSLGESKELYVLFQS